MTAIIFLRRLVFLLLLLFSGTIVTAQITFSSGSFEDVLAAAKKSGKPVFIDVYTSWCLPCKKMEKEIFPQKNVGAKYNTHFINYRIDAEKGEGVAINKKYAVAAYPTYLFINSDGVLLYKGVGYTENPADFLAFADDALKRFHSKFTIEDLKKMYTAGERKPAFVREYIEKLSELGMKETASMALDNYLADLPGITWRDTIHAKFLMKYVNDMESKVFDSILQHQSYFPTIGLPDNTVAPDIIASTREEILSILLSNLVIESLHKATSTKDKVLFHKVTANASRIENTSLKFPYTLFAFSLQFYATTRDSAAIIASARPFLKKIMDMDAATLQKDNDRFYRDFLYPYLTGQLDSSKTPNFTTLKSLRKKNFSNYLAFILYTGADRYLNFSQSTQDFKTAIQWCNKALQIGDKRPEYLNTLALLYHKTGQQQKALSTQEEAIAFAQQQNANEKVLTKYRSDLEDIKRGR